MSEDKRKEYFEEIYKRYNSKDFIDTDPIYFPHVAKGNTEFIAFTSALFAYGNVKAIKSFLANYFEYAGTDPIKMNSFSNDSIYYRFQTSADVSSYSLAMNRIYDRHGSIRYIFERHADKGINECLHLSILDIRNEFKTITNGVNFLFPIPGKSASKRLMMFLRWMIRKDEIDLGLWKGKIFQPSMLYMPVDTHIKRAAVNMGIVSSNTSPKVSLDKISNYFRELNPRDPAKYDFAISRLGISMGCKYSFSDSCVSCIDKMRCIFVVN